MASRKKSKRGRKKGAARAAAGAPQNAAGVSAGASAIAAGSAQERPARAADVRPARAPGAPRNGGGAPGLSRAFLVEADARYSWAFGIFFGLTAIVAPYGQTANGFNPDLHMAGYLQVGGLAFLLAYLFHYLRRGHDELFLPRSPMVWIVLALYLWMAISMLWAHNFYEGFVKLLDWGAAVCIFLLMLMLIRTNRTFYPILLGFYIGGLAVSLLGVGQYLFALDWVQQHQAPAATFGNKNMAGEYLVLVAPLGICLLLNSRHRLAAWFYAMSGSLIIAYLFYGRTRASWLSFAAEVLLLAGGFLVLCLKHGYRPYWERNKTYAFAASLLFLAVLVNVHPHMFSDGTLGIDSRINPSAGGAVSHSFTNTIENAFGAFWNSAGQRFVMWFNSLAMYKDHWLLGTGIGNWMVYYPLYQAAVEIDWMLVGNLYHINAHNDYIEFLCELGAVGGVMMLMLVGIILHTIWRILVRPGISNENRVFGVAASVSVLGISANAAFSFPLQQPVTIAMFLFYLAMILAVANTLNEEERDMYTLRLPSQLFKIFLVALMGLGISFLAFMHYHWYVSESHYRVASASMSLGRYKRMNQYAKVAFENNPMRTYLNIFPGSYYAKQSKYDKAIDYFEKVRSDYPYRVEIMQNLGASYLYSGKNDGAKEVFELWRRLQPHSKDLLKSYGLMMLQFGKKDEARYYLTRAKELFEEALAQAIAHNRKKNERRRRVQLDAINKALAHLGPVAAANTAVAPSP